MSRIKIALEVVNDLRSLANSIEDLVKVVETNETKPVETKVELPTLEEVRHRLALLSQSGKQPEVKALITKYGARKLSEIPKEKYPDLLRDAEEIQ